MTSTLQQDCDRAAALYRQGRRAEGEALLAAALAAQQAAAPLLLHGQMLQGLMRHDAALARFDAALALEPNSAEGWNHRGDALSHLERLEEAVESFARALEIAPDSATVLYNRANTLQQLARFDAALDDYDRALAVAPDFAQAWNNRGNALRALGRDGEALESFDRVLALHPGIAEIWNSRGALLRKLMRLDEALDSHARAATLQPGRAESWVLKGNVLRDLRRLDEALDSYDHALAADPRHAEAWNNRGVVLRDLGRLDDAVDSHTRALDARSDYAETLYNRATIAWVERRDYAAARADLERVVALDPGHDYAAGELLHLKMYGSDWRGFDRDKTMLDAGVRAGKAVAEPFIYQAVSDSPADLMACSQIHARHRYPAAPALWRGGARRAGKTRIGYVSGEFRAQATAFLMAGVYEMHDKSRFVITAFDNGRRDASPMRARLEAAFDEFVDIAALSDRAAAEAVQTCEIDILVNLNGWFGDHRMGVFAWRPAPIQVNYLGFPATLGADYIDYIVADRIVIPPDEQRFYTEQVVYLPDSYQANDSRRAVARDIPGRAECGLPPDAFVFCNFNSSYKLTPDTFRGWMRILAQVPGSVLWLLDSDGPFAENLRCEAEASGIYGARLVFAPVVPADRHLARLALADLSLDTLPYNAHTTASDALWAGVPLVTRRGTAFPGRVAASLLHAVGLPELVTEDAAGFEALAVALAQDPARLAALKAKLARNRATQPLFDTGRFCRALETAYDMMMEKTGRSS